MPKSCPWTTRVTSIPSASLEQSIDVSKRIQIAPSEYPEVSMTVAMIGRAEKGETADANYMEAAGRVYAAYGGVYW